MCLAGGIDEIILPRTHGATMIAHARAGAPSEVCGVLAGDLGRVTRVYPVPNIDPDPRRYLMNPRELLRSLRAIDELRLDLLGFYHSHPSSPALPSETDLKLAFYPESYYVIVSLQVPDCPDIRCFRLRAGRFEEILVRDEPG